LIEQIDGTYAIGTSEGFYLTAENGGGMGIMKKELSQQIEEKLALGKFLEQIQ
jgi:hypothetical protein